MIIDARHRFTEKQIFDAFNVCRTEAKKAFVRRHMDKLESLVRDLKEMERKDNEPA